MIKDKSLKLAGLDVLPDGVSVSVRYDITGEDGRNYGTLSVAIAPTDKQTVDSQIAAANRALSHRLRDWADKLDGHAEALERR